MNTVEECTIASVSQTNKLLKSEEKNINSLEYSLHDFNNAPYLNDMTISDRIFMMNSFVSDYKEREYYQYQRISLTGSLPYMNIIDDRGEYLEHVINLASNDYLHLTQHEEVKAAGIAALDKYGAGAGSVPLLAGTLDIHNELCKKIAEFKGCEDAMLFTSGFGTNYGVLSTLLRKNDVAIIDMYAHASLFEGVKHSNSLVFKHNNLESLEKKLKTAQHKYKNKIVVVDGVYSMDGDICPLRDITRLAHQYGALVLIDEAHATGVIGENGRGTPEHFLLEGKVDIVCGTFSKGIGSVGGFVASSKELIQYLKFLSRPYFFSTAPAPSVAGSILKSLDVIQSDTSLRRKLWTNINCLKDGLSCISYDLSTAETAILPLIIGDDTKVKELCLRLHRDKIYTNPVPYPAVPRRLSRVRLSVTSGLSLNDIDYVVERIKKHSLDLAIFS